MRRLAGILIALALALVGTGWVVTRSSGERDAHRRTDDAHVTDDAPYEVPEPVVEPEPEAQKPKARPARSNAAEVAEPTGVPDGSALHVQVVDGAGGAMRGVAVGLTLSIDGVGTTGPQAKTDAVGRCSFDDLRADQVIAANAVHGALTRSAMLRLTDGQASELSFEVPSGFEVHGTIRDVQSGPIPHVSVALRRETGKGRHDWAHGSTDNDGVYSIPGVPPGKWEIELSGGAVRTESGPARRIEYHERKQGELVVRDATRRDIVLGKLSIEGTVRDGATGELLGGVTVNLQDPHWGTTKTDSRGRFAMASMPPGRYRIFLKKEGYVLKWVRDVEITEHDVARVEFKIDRGAGLTVQLRDPDGKPVTGEHWFRFDREDKKGWSSNLVADAEGNATSKVVPLGPMKISVSGAGWTGGPVEIDIQPGVNTVIVPVKRIAGSGQRSLSGIVRDSKTRAPITGVQLRIRSGMNRTAHTDDSGRFVFEDLRPTSHRVYVSCEGYADHWAKGVKTVNGEETKIEIELEPAAKIHLRLTDATGAPVSGEIYFVYVGGTPRAGRGLRLTLDEDGRATFARLAPGPYAISIDVKKRGGVNQKLEVKPGENLVELQLSK
jgi:hypothetical protein